MRPPAFLTSIRLRADIGVTQGFRIMTAPGNRAGGGQVVTELAPDTYARSTFLLPGFHDAAGHCRMRAR